MKRKRKTRGLGSSPEKHAEDAVAHLLDSMQNASRAEKHGYSDGRSCGKAMWDLRAASDALALANENASLAGPRNPTMHMRLGAAGDRLESLFELFAKRCVI